MALRPAADSCRFGFFGGFSAPAFCFLYASQRAVVAAEIFFRAAALSLRFFGADPSLTVTDGFAVPRRE
jgi:hypothetical protein